MYNSDHQIIKQLEIIVTELKKGSLDKTKKSLLSKAIILLGTALDSNNTQAERLIKLIKT